MGLGLPHYRGWGAEEALEHGDGPTGTDIPADAFICDQLVAIKAVSQHGFSLVCASEELRDNREVVLQAVSHTGRRYPQYCWEFHDGSEKPSPEPLLKKDASPAVLGGREFWKCSGGLKCLKL